MFDDEFYVLRNPEVAGSGLTPWRHFLEIGAARDRDPHWLFSVAYYRKHGPDLGDANPLIHFIEQGLGEGRPFHWLFSEDLYVQANPDLAAWHGEPVQHLLRFGLFENRVPHPLFDPDWYRRRYPDVDGSGWPVFKHFLVNGDREGRAPHPLFDPGFYRSMSGFTGAGGAFEHFVMNGAMTQAHPLFDPSFYFRTRPAGLPAAEYPLLDYVLHGGPAGAWPHSLFDTPYYLRQTNDPAARQNALAHYLEVGRQHGISPCPLFESHFYQQQTPNRSWTGGTLPLSGPRISVLVPVYNTPAGVLRECIESVRNQTYADWELCLVDDASTSAETVAVLDSYRGLDERIRIERLQRNQHIARATNCAALQASGEFLAFLDHDDTIEPDALAQIAAAVIAQPDIDLLYTDEDKIDETGAYRDTYHKPDWSPEHLRSVMYILHFLVVRKALFWRVGGSRPERTGAQDYDLALRIAREARRVCHIPRILYHWRMLAGSAAAAVDAKPYGLEAGRAALEDSLAAAGEDASVEDGLLVGTFRVRPRLTAKPAVSLVILTNDRSRDVPGRGRINLVRNFVRSIAEKSSYGNYRLVVVDDGNASAETRRLVKQVGGSIVSFELPDVFNYAAKANFATAQAETENLVYLNDDLEVISPDWIEALLELSVQPAIGGVGGRLLYPDGTIQHSGVVLGVQNSTGHAFLGLERGAVGYNNFTHVIRNYSAVTGAVFATRRSVMEKVRGFDEQLAIDYNDIDLCLRIGEAGYRIAFTPFCELFHFEGSSITRSEANPVERNLFRSRWQSLIDADPFYNPNLPRDRLTFA